MQIPKRSATPPMPPAGVRQWLERTPQGNDALESAVRQLATAYEKVHTQTDRIMADQTVNRNARTVRAAKAARATLSPAVRALESARGEAAKARDFLTRKINEPFQTSDRLIGDLLLDGQIRQHFAGLPSDQRIAALRNALDSRDAVTLRALTSAPAYLSGLADPLYETAQRADSGSRTQRSKSIAVAGRDCGLCGQS